jgi:preprotein translocase subunit SecG
MQQIIFLIHILSAVCLIALVLIQHGKGADAGAAFGSGASQTMFGSIGAMPFLIKVTALVAATFFITSLSLGVIIAKQVKHGADITISAPLNQKSNN